MAPSARIVGDGGPRPLHILEMVHHTRLDCVLGSTALMRRALAQATRHAAHRRRSAAGSDQPLMLRCRRPLRRERGGDGAGAAPRAGL